MPSPFENISAKKQDDIKDFLELNPALKQRCNNDPNSLDAYEIVDYWLQYNGIIGFTGPIVTLVEDAYKGI